MHPISVSTVAFDGHSLEKAFVEAASLGFAYVEPAYIKGYLDFSETTFSGTNANGIAASMRAAGVRAIAISAHMDLGDVDAPAMLQRRLEFAASLGAGFVITNASTKDRRAACLATIEAVLSRAEALNIRILLENPGHGTGALIGNGADGAALVAALGSPFVALNYDVGNIWSYSHGALQPDEDIVHAVPCLAHLHLKDIVEIDGDWRFCALGDGSARLASTLSTLKRMGCRVPIGIELPARLSRPRKGDPVRNPQIPPIEEVRAALTRSLAFVEAQL